MLQRFNKTQVEAMNLEYMRLRQLFRSKDRQLEISDILSAISGDVYRLVYVSRDFKDNLTLNEIVSTVDAYILARFNLSMEAA